MSSTAYSSEAPDTLLIPSLIDVSRLSLVSTVTKDITSFAIFLFLSNSSLSCSNFTISVYVELNVALFLNVPGIHPK